MEHTRKARFVISLKEGRMTRKLSVLILAIGILAGTMGLQTVVAAKQKGVIVAGNGGTVKIGSGGCCCFRHP
jgi:hypothetical protein